MAELLRRLSHREVADELGISVGAVKARLHQARAALAPRLASFKTTREREAIAVTSTEAVEWTEVTVTKVLRGQRADREEPDFVMFLADRLDLLRRGRGGEPGRAARG